MGILRDEDFYYQYEQNGGTVEMPKEVFWELYNDSKEEIERLNNGLKDIKWYIEKNKTSFSDLYIPASDVVSVLVIIDRLLGSDKE